MLWIILTIVGAALSWFFTLEGKNKSYGFSMASITVAGVFAFIVLTQLIWGITDYPCLVRQKAQIESLNTRVQDIKESVYAYEKDGTFVAGSIENYKQSTNLSKYISDLAKKEAKFNGYLQECIAYKESFMLKFFSHGWAISDKIYELAEE